MADHDHALGQRFDIVHVVGGEDHRYAFLCVEGAYNLAHRQLDDDCVRLLLCDLNEQPRALIRSAGFDAVLGEENITSHLGAALARATQP